MSVTTAWKRPPLFSEEIRAGRPQTSPAPGMDREVSVQQPQGKQPQRTGRRAGAAA